MTITNQDVLNALNSCIEQKWTRIYREGKRESDVADCALCALFDGGLVKDFTIEGSGYKPNSGCKGCPLFLMNKGLGCGEGSTYAKFGTVPPDDVAKYRGISGKMLGDLKKARKHFFG